MTLQVLGSRPYTLLPSGTLIVEPHEGLLAARSMLLAAADHYVGVSISSGSEANRTEGCEVTIAILSESLGYAFLCETAQIVRKNWPRASILIFGSSHAAIEDSLYDFRIDHQARPEDLLAALLMLAEYPRNHSESYAYAGGHLVRRQSGQIVDWRRCERNSGGWPYETSDECRGNDIAARHAGGGTALEAGILGLGCARCWLRWR